MVAESIEGFERNCVDRFRSDKRIDIFNVTKVRILGSGTGPEQSLHTSALMSQLFESLASEHLLINLIS